MLATASSVIRSLPKDFVESSQTGGIFTVLAYIAMFVVFISELGSFMVGKSGVTTNIQLDTNSDKLLQINFNDIECRNLKVTVYDEFGKEPISSASRDFWLRSVDTKGRTFGMTYQPKDTDEDVQEAKGVMSEERMHQRRVEELQRMDGKKELDADWASSTDGFQHGSFLHLIEAHDFVVVNFFAGWCSHCRNFSPRWNLLAERVNGRPAQDGQEATEPQKFPDREEVPKQVRLVKINCVDFQNVCREQGVDAYPTIRMYKYDGTFSLFEGKRDEADIMRWIERTVKLKSYGWAKDHESFERGCNANGRLLVPRVPGHFELLVGAGDQSLNSRMTNVSHIVKHLSFSDPDDGRYHKKHWSSLPADIVSNIAPIDGKTYITQDNHQEWAHDLKVVSTVSPKGKIAYQVMHQTRLRNVAELDVPQAKFFYDIEPFSIQIQKESTKWYDFCTSMLAILGGTFVTMKVATQVTLGTASMLSTTTDQVRQQRRPSDLTFG